MKLSSDVDERKLLFGCSDIAPGDLNTIPCFYLIKVNKIIFRYIFFILFNEENFFNAGDIISIIIFQYTIL